MAVRVDRGHHGHMLDMRDLKTQDLQGLSDEAAQQIIEHIQRLSRDIRLKDARLEKVSFELARLKAWRFAAKTESMSAEQRRLFEEAWVEDEASLQAQLQALQAKLPEPLEPQRSPKRQPRRQALPEHLQRVEHRHEPEDTTCPSPQCGREMVRVGEDVSERLDIVPAQFFVHRHIYGKWACKCCQLLVQEPAAPQIIDGGMPAAGLVAHTLISRFVDHLPYYRQEGINARSGVHTPRSTLAAWSGQGGAALQPLYDAHKRFVLNTRVLHADETPVAMLDPGAGKTKRAYVWAYARGALDETPGVVYDFCLGRGAQYPVAFLQLEREARAQPVPLPTHWQGTLVRDEYKAYATVLDPLKYPGRTAAGCLAHARRKFDELLKANASALAGEAAHRGDLPRREGTRRADSRRAAGQAPSEHQAAVGGAASVAAARAYARARRQRHGAGHRLQPEPLGGADAQPARRRGAGGQQPSGKPNASLGHGKKSMAVRRQRVGRPARGHRDEPGAVGQAQRPRSLGLPQGRADSAAHAAEQPHRGTAAASLATQRIS
jgi:transposase